jgi:hypothetical protein
MIFPGAGNKRGWMPEGHRTITLKMPDHELRQVITVEVNGKKDAAAFSPDNGSSGSPRCCSIGGRRTIQMAMRYADLASGHDQEAV